MSGRAENTIGTEEMENQVRAMKARNYPAFPVDHPDPFPGQSEESYRRDCLYREIHMATLGRHLALARKVCTILGHDAQCANRGCRRHRRCSGRRPPDHYGLGLGVIIPPCVPLEEERIEQIRDEIRAMLWPEEISAGTAPNERPPRYAKHPLDMAAALAACKKRRKRL